MRFPSCDLIPGSSTLTRQQWLSLRREGIGGSDAAAVVGVNPWRSPLSAWLEKTTPPTSGEDATDAAPSEAALWGNLLEDVVAKEFSRRTGFPVRRVRGVLRKKEAPWQLATLDRITKDGSGRWGVLEIKTSSPWRRGEWEDGAIPKEYALQVAHYLSVTGLPFAYVVCLLGGQELITRHIPRDDRLITALDTIEARFWDCVQTGTPPAPGGSSADSEALASMFPTGSGEAVTLPEEASALSQTFEEARAEERAAALRKDEAANKLKALLGENPEGSTALYRVRWSPVTTKRLDTKGLKAAHAALCEQFTAESVSRRFDVARLAAD